MDIKGPHPCQHQEKTRAWTSCQGPSIWRLPGPRVFPPERHYNCQRFRLKISKNLKRKKQLTLCTNLMTLRRSFDDTPACCPNLQCQCARARTMESIGCWSASLGYICSFRPMNAWPQYGKHAWIIDEEKEMLKRPFPMLICQIARVSLHFRCAFYSFTL